MKKTIFLLAITLFMAGTISQSCQSPADKVEDASEKVDKAQANMDLAQQELDLAIKDSIQQFKKESEEKIAKYDHDIVAFKEKIAKENYENRARDERKLAELEQQNNEMKQRLADFNEGRRDQWGSFRAKFNHDMEEHDKAFRNFWGIRK